MNGYAIAGLAGLILAPSAAANEVEPAMRAYLEAEIVTWATSEVIVSALVAQNLETAHFDQARIDALDQSWRGELGQTVRPTIVPVLANPAADFLREQVAASGGRITEAFVMDARGLNVAVSHVTSDYWQGDEAKFTETFTNGRGAFHFGDVELDASTERYQGQISITISDPVSGNPIGALTVGIDAGALM